MHRRPFAVALTRRSPRRCPIGVVSADCRTVPGALFQHLRDGRVVQVKSVLDGVATSVQRPVQPNSAVGMAGNFLLPAVCLVDDGLQFFNRQEQTPTCVIMPPGRSVNRALELLPYVKGIGRPTLVVASSEQPFLPTQADVVLPVPQAVPEVFSPLVYCLAGELLAYYLAEVREAEFFQATRSFRSGGDRLRDSHTLRHPDELELLEAEAQG